MKTKKAPFSAPHKRNHDSWRDRARNLTPQSKIWVNDKSCSHRGRTRILKGIKPTPTGDRSGDQKGRRGWEQSARVQKRGGDPISKPVSNKGALARVSVRRGGTKNTIDAKINMADRGDNKHRGGMGEKEEVRHHGKRKIRTARVGLEKTLKPKSLRHLIRERLRSGEGSKGVERGLRSARATNSNWK